MVINKSFWVWLAVLTVPVVTLIAVQVDTSTGASIGGGGYDLGPFLYSWLLIVFTGLWSLCALGFALLCRTRVAAMRALALTAIGLVTFVAVLVLYGDNLS